MPRFNDRFQSAAGFSPASLKQGDGRRIRAAAARILSRRDFDRATASLGPSALRPLIGRLHRQHRRLGGTRLLPDLTGFTSRHLRLLAQELQRANKGLKGGE